MKRFVLSMCGLGMAAMVLWGCPKQQNTASSSQPSSSQPAANGSDADAKPPFTAYSTGIPKYDNYFQRVYRLRYKLWKADRDLARTPATLRSVMELPGDVKNASITEMLKVAANKFGSKLTLAGGHIRLRAGVNDPKAAKVAQTVDNVFTTTKRMPENLGGAVDESRKLVTQGERLTRSVKSDFTGFNAMKAPAVTAKLAESVKELGKVPGQVKQLGGTSVEVAKAIPPMFSKKE